MAVIITSTGIGAAAAEQGVGGSEQVGTSTSTAPSDAPPETGPNGETPQPQAAAEEDARLAWQMEFLRVTDAVRLDFPSELAEVHVERDLQSGTVGFKGAAPAQAVEALSGLSGISIQENFGYSEVEVLAGAAQLFDESVDRFGEMADVETGFNTEKRAYEVSLSEREGSPSMRSSGEALQLDRPAEIPDQLPITVQVVSGEPLESQDLQGGHVIYQFGELACTAAFPVKQRNGSAIGVLTAGHCPGSSTTWTPTGGRLFTVEPFSQATTDVSPGGDFRWLHSNVMFDGQTWNGYKYNRFQGASNPPGGTNVCKYGAVTGHGCSYVNQIGVGAFVDVRPEDGGGTYRVAPLTCTEQAITQPGDSGGPWYGLDVAFGIHSVGNDYTSCFASVPLALSRFGLQLWVG